MASSHGRPRPGSGCAPAEGPGPRRQMACGTPTESSALHAIRARALALVRPAERESLAFALRRILADAAKPTRRVGPRVVPPRLSILGAAGILAVLIDRLRSPEPVSARGVAKVRALVHDGAGPLYYPAAGNSLRRSVEDAIQALDPPLAW